LKEQDMAIKVALMGAGGKLGCRITDNIKDMAEYDIAYIEISEQGIANLAKRSVSPTPQDEALAGAEVVILALPDRIIGKVTQQIVPTLNPGTMLLGLDPAAAYAEVMPIRDNLSYFVSHPCHPPLFETQEKMPFSENDWFGGDFNPQHIVCALHHGPEADYARGEKIAIDMYSPVIKSHRITVEQMAILEPALVETFSATLIQTMWEMMNKVIEMGVPEEAARAFLFGHIRIELAIIFGFAGFPFSDGAKLAIEKARPRIFQPGWQENVMNIENIQQSVREITDHVSGV
jgi:hypothetical protein